MTGLEMMGLGVGLSALYESNEKHHWTDTALETISKPAEHWDFKHLVLILVLIVLLTYIWYNVLQGYIWE